MIVNRVTLLGNKDHGKSTLIGNLLIQTGSVSEQRINDAKKTSKKLGRQFEPGYILDSFEEERLNEMTIDTTRAQIKYKNTGFEFIDVPGHEELMKNMLSGASYADFALLIISAKPGEGITDQTKRHLFVAKMMGINKLIVAVNKLDTVGYEEAAFAKIEKGIKEYLGKIGFEKGNVSFIPVSAYNADNLVKLSSNMRWYKGPTLIDALVNKSKAKKAAGNQKLVIQFQGLFDEQGKSVFGKILSGSLKRNTKIIVMPNGKETKVLEIFVSGKKKSTATKGNVVTLKLDKSIGKDVKGLVASNQKDACRTGDTIHALLLTTRQLKGPASIKINGLKINCKRMVITKTIDVSTGECRVSSTIKPLDAGSIELKLERNVATDSFDKTPEIGRFIFYTNNNFSGIGIITD